MERSQSASSGHARQDDIWTCQRCGWVYPNAHPSAKHRRNHKKNCGKIKGFELQSELRKGGSSDEASSDDGSHVNKDSLPLQSAQTQHDSHRPVEASSEVLVIEPPSALKTRELLLPETNISNIIKPETPVHGISASHHFKPEVAAYKPTQEVDRTDVVKPESYAAEHVRDFGPSHKTSRALGDNMDVNIKELAGEPTIASDSLEGNGNMGVLSRAEGVDMAVQDSLGLSSNQIGGALEKDSMLLASPERAGRIACLDEPFKTIEEGRVNSLPHVDEVKKAAQESQVLESDQSRETQKKEISTTPSKHPISRQGSSQEDDSWTCRHCGWVYPNPHPSAKQRRNHKKLCGKVKGFEMQTEPHKGGSSDEVSSDEEKREHIQHDLQQDTSQITPAQYQASGSITSTTTSAEDQARNLFTPKEKSSAEGLPDTLNLKSVTTKMETSDVDPAVSPAQENLYGEDEKGAIAVDHSTLIPCNSDGPGIFQTKEELLSIQAIGPERHFKEVPIIALSEGVNDLVSDTSDDFVSTSKVSEAPHDEISEDSTPNVENTSLLTVLPSDASQLPIVGSSKAEGDETGAVVMPISHPKASGCTIENLDAFGGTGFQQDVHNNERTDGAAEADLVKPNSSAGERFDSKFSCDNHPVLAAGSALDGKAENLPAEGSSVKSVLPVVAFSSLANDLESDKKLASLQTTPNAGEGSSLKEDGLRLVALPIAEVTGSTDDLEGEKKFVTVQATPNPIESQPKDDVSSEIVGGLKDSSSSSMDKVVEAPEVTEMPVQFLEDRATSVEEGFSKERSTSADSEKGITFADTSGGAVSLDDTTTSVTFSREPKVIPEGVSLTSAEDTLATSTKDKISGQIVGNLERTFSSSADKVVETPGVSEMLAQSSDSPGTFEGVAVSKERATAHTPGESLSSDYKPTSTAALRKSEAIPERGPSALIADTLATSTIMNMAKNSGSSSPQKNEQLSLVNDDHKDKTTEVSGPPEILEKPDIKDNTPSETDFGSSGRSLDGTNSFANAESEFSQRSDFASLSQKLSDSAELFEDAPDTLEACSVGGSVEESESLDEQRQLIDGVQEEDSKPLRVASLDEREAGVSDEQGQKPNGVNGATNEVEHTPNVMNGASDGEVIGEEKATTMPAGSSYAARSNTEELKAPSPEAWQEPGPSTLRREGKKMSTSEVMEYGKSSEPHTALRSLMAKEGKDRMDEETAASPSVTVDAKNSVDKEASANDKKPKSKMRSFWSHCVCCPAVH